MFGILAKNCCSVGLVIVMITFREKKPRLENHGFQTAFLSQSSSLINKHQNTFAD
jgi:hypothetical protein